MDPLSDPRSARCALFRHIGLAPKVRAANARAGNVLVRRLISLALLRLDGLDRLQVSTRNRYHPAYLVEQDVSLFPGQAMLSDD